HLHSFPTRRSSDLERGVIIKETETTPDSKLAEPRALLRSPCIFLLAFCPISFSLSFSCSDVLLVSGDKLKLIGHLCPPVRDMSSLSALPARRPIPFAKCRTVFHIAL